MELRSMCSSVKTLKSIVCALVLLVPSFLIRADPPLRLPVTNAIAGVTTNTANLEWAMDLSRTVTLQCVGSLANVGTSNLTVLVQWSANRTNWHTAATMLLAMNGTNQASYLTNLDTMAMPWMRVYTFANANTAAVNYLEFVVGRKRGL